MNAFDSQMLAFIVIMALVIGFTAYFAWND